jgi:hypothetical protein
MKLNHFFLIASLILLGIACPFSTVVTPTATTIPGIATPIPSKTIPPTNVPATIQPSAPATVAPQISTDGPYLVYLRDQGNRLELVLMDADGKGEAAFPYPLNRNVYTPRSLSNLVSPDGSWLAFYTGSLGQASGNDGSDEADLTLNLMSLGIKTPAGSTQVITHLLSADYPANFDQAVQELGRSDITAQELQDTFVYGITQSIAWSPDGQYLAFAGQMDGLSSDLYLYNTADETIQRLSSGPEEVQWIEWSPDGKWILDASTYWVGLGMTYNFFATSVDGKVVRSLLKDSPLEPGQTWINPHSFLAYHSTNGPGSGLERVDIDSGSVDKVWDGHIFSQAVDVSGNWLALYDYDQGGLFLIDLKTLKATRVQDPNPTHVYGTVAILRNSREPARLFMTWDENDLSLYYLSSNGALTSAGTSANFFSVAPNQADWIAIQDNNIQVFPGSGSQARIFKLPDGMAVDDFQAILWRPDLSGIFLASSAGQLYTLDFSSGISTLVEEYLSTYDPVSGIPAGLIWVRK